MYIHPYTCTCRRVNLSNPFLHNIANSECTITTTVRRPQCWPVTIGCDHGVTYPNSDDWCSTGTLSVHYPSHCFASHIFFYVDVTAVHKVQNYFKFSGMDVDDIHVGPL